MDFRIDDEGELSLIEDMEVDYSDDYLRQMVLSRIVSVTNNWYGDNIGANIEEMFGAFIVPDKTDTSIKDKIYNALFIDEVFNSDNVYIETNNIANTLEYNIKVYIKSVDNLNKSINIAFKLDLFNGRLVR